MCKVAVHYLGNLESYHRGQRQGVSHQVKVRKAGMGCDSNPQQDYKSGVVSADQIQTKHMGRSLMKPCPQKQNNDVVCCVVTCLLGELSTLPCSAGFKPAFLHGSPSMPVWMPLSWLQSALRWRLRMWRWCMGPQVRGENDGFVKLC